MGKRYSSTRVLVIAFAIIIALFALVRVACAQDTTLVYEIYDTTIPDSSHGGDALIIPITFDLTDKNVYILSGGAVGLGYSFFKETDYETGLYLMPSAVINDSESTYYLGIGIAITINSLLGTVAEFGPTFGYAYNFFTTSKTKPIGSHEIFFAIPLTR